VGPESKLDPAPGPLPWKLVRHFAASRSQMSASTSPPMEAAVLEARLAVRSLRRRPWFALAVAVLLGAALLAAWIPARQALRGDPADALRAE